MARSITLRSENFAQWYQDIIKEADLAENSSVRGCMIIKPWGFAIWERIQKILDKMIKDTGHQNVYFPMLIPLRFLEKEAAHVDGFAKECAVVTHYRLEANSEGKLVPAPDAKLQEPLIIRPTSETVIGEAMASWVQSYKDLPILINQWCNVMRWEMRPRLFLRTSEFLWQEGHTAHATSGEALEETLKMLDVYEDLAWNYLAIPVIKGEKTENERFPGAVHTYTIEAMMQDGKALQAGTSHFLGQNFSKAYDISYMTKEQEKEYAWTTSWGVTTRLVGALVMTHSDDEGLVLPPQVAPHQVILIPVIKKDDSPEEIISFCKTIASALSELTWEKEPLRVHVDTCFKSPQDKFWEAVKKGVPLRIEVGKREMESGILALSKRTGPAKERFTIKTVELESQIPALLTQIQASLLENALSYRNKNTVSVTSMEALEAVFSKDETHSLPFVKVYYHPQADQIETIQEKLKTLKISVRCAPLGNQDKEGLCLFTHQPTHQEVILARSY